MAKAKEQLTAARAECKAQNPDTIWRPYVRYGDLQTLMQAERKLIALKVDHGELTKDEANLQLAQVASEVREQELQRSAHSEHLMQSDRHLHELHKLLRGHHLVTRISRPPQTGPCLEMASTRACVWRCVLTWMSHTSQHYQRLPDLWSAVSHRALPPG
jgi:hypothetical protein